MSIWSDPSADPFPKGEPTSPRPPLVCKPSPRHPISSIPPRPWAYGKFLLFGIASALGGADGSGKGAHAVVICLAMITGRPLLGEHVWRNGPVAIITYEDDEIEWRRRIAAACIHYKIDYEEVIESFHFIARPGERVCLAQQSFRGSVVFPDGDDIISDLKKIGAVLLVLDPFNHAHALEDGNNNALIAQVAGEITRIAHESGAAALVLHHLRKGATGNADDFMGAVSLRAAFRSVRIIARMLTEQANGLGLPPQQAWRYTRITGSKENYAPPPELTTWYKLEGVDLFNITDLYPDGDNVHVATRWDPPDAFEGISRTIIAEIFAAIRIPPEPGLCWSPDPRSGAEWVGTIIAAKTKKSLDQVKAIVRTWIDKDKAVLIKNSYHHPKQSKNKPCVALNEAKAAEILGPLYFNQEDDE
jgi:hypothetical protein